MIRGELAIGRGSSRHTLVFGGSDADPNHDAVMRIGGEAPRRRAHSLRRRASHACLGSPPPRIVMGIASAICRREAPISLRVRHEINAQFGGWEFGEMV